MRFDHHERGAGGARAYASGAFGGHQRSRNCADRRRRAAEEPGQAHSGRNRPAGLDCRRSVVQRRAGHGEDAERFQVVEEDLNRVKLLTNTSLVADLWKTLWVAIAMSRSWWRPYSFK